MSRQFGTVRRGARSLRRRVRWLMVRAAHPRVRLGKGCDIRRGLSLSIWPGATVELGQRCVVDRAMTIECRGRLEVGQNVIFGHHVTIGVNDLVRIGDDCLIAEMVSIRDHDHKFSDTDTPIRLQGARSKHVDIGRDVWLGTRAVVTAGVTVGDHAIIAAGSVVTKDIAPWSIVAGVPARTLGSRRSGDRATTWEV